MPHPRIVLYVLLTTQLPVVRCRTPLLAVRAYTARTHLTADDVPSNTVRSYVFMIQQLSDPAARWHLYLQSLPQVYEDPLWWPPAAVAAVQGTTLAGAVRDRQKWLADAYEAAVEAYTAEQRRTRAARRKHQELVRAVEAWHFDGSAPSSQRGRFLHPR